VSYSVETRDEALAQHHQDIGPFCHVRNGKKQLVSDGLCRRFDLGRCPVGRLAYHPEAGAQLWRPAWIESNLERIRAPTLVVWDQDDPWHSLSMARKFGRRITGVEVVILPECGHLPHEERPDEFNPVVQTFLKSRWHHDGR
jgi:pimeloyl-ACP methyl ester carboxylesterase